VTHTSSSEKTVTAVGKVTEALETVEIARGQLYHFHQLTGSADFTLGEAADLLAEAGHTELAERIRTEMVGRNVIAGRWTFQVVEEYDETYYEPFRELEREVRTLTGGRKHVHEARLKEERRTHGRPGHEKTPES
jgi:hypothetical protein